MSKQINQYTKTRTSGTLTLFDLLDIDSTDDSGVSYESAKITVSSLLGFLNTNISNLYNSDDSLTEDRIVDGLSLYDLNFNNIDTFEINADNNIQLNSLGTIGLVSITNLSIISGADITLDPSGFIIGGTLAVSPTGTILMSIEGGINTEDAYYLDNLKILSRFNMGDGGISLGKNGLQNAAAGSRNVALGDVAGLSVTTGIRSVYVGGDCAYLTNDSYSFFGGFNCAFELTGANSGNIMIGASAGTNVTSGSNNIILGRDAGALVNGNYNSSMAFGKTARFNADNQLIIGSTAAFINDVWYGSGFDDTSINYTTFTENMTNIADGTTDKAGNMNWIRNATRGTGTGVGGDHIWKVAPESTTGSTVNALVEILRLKGDGNINMSNLPTSSAGLASGDIWSNSGVLTVV